MKRAKLYGVAAVAVVALVGWLDLSGQVSSAHASEAAAQHQVTVARADASVATDLANQGVTGIGMPNTERGIVPFTVQPGCVVGMSLAVTHGTATLFLTISTGTGKVHPVDTVTDGPTAAAVRGNIPALGLCK